jgi:uncharacterized protein DUF3293
MPLDRGDPWVSYARTVVEIVRPTEGNVVVRSATLGVVGTWPWPWPGPVHILTAWDPGDERRSERDNRLHQTALEADLRPMADGIWVAVGVDPVSGHREEGVAVAGVSEADAAALGARYRQDALFAWTPVAWTIVACAGGRRLASGWSITHHEPGT